MSQGLQAWLEANKLTKFKILSSLNENGVDDLDDLTALEAGDLEELVNDMKLKVVPRKKFLKAALKLIGANDNANQPGSCDDEKKTDEGQSRKRKNKPNHVGIVEVPKVKSIDPSTRHRTIMVIGATGTGKTTLLNSMVNYLWEVDYEDPFRYKLVYGPEKANAQAESQTDDVTAYHLNPPALDYQLTVIDTPGFGDTRGINHDEKITQNIKIFFETKIQEIDAVCFVIRAPQARLTATQKYIFNQVLGIFGNDIKENLFVLLTFADNDDPPALAALKADKVPFKESFKLNNSGFKLAKKTKNGGKTKNDIFGPIYWDMGIQAFAELFTSLDTLKTKSLALTKQVLVRREQLETYVVGIKPTINRGFEVFEDIRKQIAFIDKYADLIDANKDFMVDYTVTKHRKDYNITGNTTTCLNCNYTCHQNCRYSDNADKANCPVMNSSGNCTICPDRCHWTMHKNLPYLITWYTETVKKPIQCLKDKYDNAKSKQSACKGIISGLKDKLSKTEQDIGLSLNNIRNCINDLSSIALRPNLSNDSGNVFYQMMKAEEWEKRTGWEKRCKLLRQLKQKQDMLTAIALNRFDPWAKYADVQQFINKKG